MFGNDLISMLGLFISSDTIIRACWVSVCIEFFSCVHGFTLNTWQLGLLSVCSLFAAALTVASGIEVFVTFTS